MRYLKRFESVTSPIVKDLEDIFIDVFDDNNLPWEVKCWENKSWIKNNSKFIIIISRIDNDYDPSIGTKKIPSIIIDSIQRSIEYMKGIGFINEITFEEDDDDDQIEIEVDDLIKLNVWINNFIKIEFH